jgi:hypothetical protein
MNEERRFNSETYILDGPPYEPVDHDRPCPARLRPADGDGRRWVCALTIKAGRTKHARAHDFQLVTAPRRNEPAGRIARHIEVHVEEPA